MPSPKARLDGGQQIGHRRLAIAVQRQQLRAVTGQGENVGGLADQLQVEELLQLLWPQPVDVERLARHEQLEVAQALERTAELPAAPAHHIFGLVRSVAAHGRRGQRAGADVGEREGLAAWLAPVQQHIHDLRDHIARALHHHMVAGPQVLAAPHRPATGAVQGAPGDEVLIVQGGIGHHHAPHAHRAQARHRREGAGAAHLDVDGIEDRDRPLGRKLVGDGPAGKPRDDPQPCLKPKVIDLVDHPVDVIAKFRPADAQAAIVRQKPGRIRTQHHIRIGGKAPGGQPLHRFALSGRKRR
jgi:hypothetical protein